jgi:hypothetical protein
MKKKFLILLFLSLIIVTVCALSNITHGQEQSPLFSVERLVIAADIQNREPIGIADTFPSTTEMVYCFLETNNIKEDTKVIFKWYYEGKEIHSYEMPLKKGDRWRTFAYKNLYGKRGTWEVAIEDSAGKTVKTVSFTVE